MVAQPLHISVEEACRTIITKAFESVASLVAESSGELGEKVGSYSLFAYGGNGGLFACGVAEKVGLQQVYFFDLGPVFSAFGSSVSDISHVYERTIPMAAISEKDLPVLNRILEEIKADGQRDLLGEGIKPDGIEHSIELDIPRPGRPAVTVSFPESGFHDFQALRELCGGKAGNGGDGISLELMRVKIQKAMPKPALVRKPTQGSDAAHALKGARKVAWGSANGEAKLYGWESLQPGNRVTGCAVLEGANSTYFLPEGWSLVVDEYGNAKLNRG